MYILFLQNTKPASLSLKRSASTNSAGSSTRRKIAKNNFGDRTLCDCDLVCQCDQMMCEAENVQAVFQDDSKSSCWPRDWLPKDCPGVRVIALSYTTDPYLWRPVWIKKRHRYVYTDTYRYIRNYLLSTIVHLFFFVELCKQPV